MKKITLVLNDDALCEDLAAAAKRNGVTFEDVVVNAIRYWKAETELAPEEVAEIEGGMRSREEGDSLSWEELNRMLEEDDAKLRAAFLNLEREGGAEARAFLETLSDKMNRAAQLSSHRAAISTAKAKASPLAR